MKQLYRVATALALASTCLCATAVDRVDAVIGETPIVLPDSSGLAKSSNESVLRFARSTLTPGKRLLAVWIDREQGTPDGAYFPRRHRYAVSYTMSALEWLDATPADFDQVKLAVGEGMADLRAGAAEKPSEGLNELRGDLRAKGIDPDSDISLEPASTELLSENEFELRYLMLVPIRIGQNDESMGRVWLLNCANVLLIRSKVVTVNVFSLFEGAEDRAWVTRECGELVHSIHAANRAAWHPSNH